MTEEYFFIWKESIPDWIEVPGWPWDLLQERRLDNMLQLFFSLLYSKEFFAKLSGSVARKEHVRIICSILCYLSNVHDGFKVIFVQLDDKAP